ncbi:spore coat protein [Rossellomorea vietnamensis]|uniref:Spore coat protein n=1 Tax=Rossellomorea vietnamensis TaxID=218284 RepID=A0A5D4NET8_9BACI|nr:spore coat protein [Rossellomorea vietnamensis]
MFVNHHGINPNDQRIFFGRPGFGFGRPGFGFGRPGFGFGRPGFGFGFGVPFITGLAAGALLTPRPYYYPPYPYYPYPYY